jgi:two-component system, cell cycle sensor histidine kinase and response regulator CckA
MPPLILVVEDEPTVRRLACRQLEKAGFDTLAAASAAEATGILDAGQIPELLVLDVRLPDLYGPEFALRIQIRYPRLPVVFISGWPDIGTHRGDLGASQWLFLEKPFSGKALVQAVRDLLASR